MTIDDPNNPLFRTAPLQFPGAPGPQRPDAAQRGGRRHAAFDPSAPEDDLDALLGPAGAPDEQLPAAPGEPSPEPPQVASASAAAPTVEPTAPPVQPAAAPTSEQPAAASPFDRPSAELPPAALPPSTQPSAELPPSTQPFAAHDPGSPLDLGTAPPSSNGTGPSAAIETPGSQLSDALRAEMLALLGRSGGRLRAVFDQYRTGVTSPAAIAASGAATEPVSAALVGQIRTLLGEPWTGSPGGARPVAAAIRALLRAPDLSRDARQYLTGLRGQLLELADSDAGRAAEQAQLEANSIVLQRELRTANGVFVYTYPHYWRHPYIADANRLLLKLEMTAQGAWQQVLDQARSSGAPEEPVLLRLYVSPDPVAAERVIHRLLESADHTRHATHAGAREWFATTLEFLDEIAHALSFDIKAGADPVL